MVPRCCEAEDAVDSARTGFHSGLLLPTPAPQSVEISRRAAAVLAYNSFSVPPTRWSADAVFITPQGRLGLEPGDTAPPLDQDVAARLESAFARGPGHGLLQLGAGEVGSALPPVLSFWRDLGARYVTALCKLPDAAERNVAERDATEQAARARPAPPPEEEVEPLARAAPPMTGA